MGLGSTLLLGLIAGGTILLGCRSAGSAAPRRPCALLNAVAVGVLLFLVWDVLSAAWEPIDTALAAVHDGTGGLGGAFGYGALFVGGLASGCSAWSPTSSWIADASPSVRARGR